MSDKFEWLPILAALGESTVARIIEKSPDIQSAILKAHEEFTTAEKEADALARQGHERE